MRSVEVYPIDVNPIEVYPIEPYLIGKGVVEKGADAICGLITWQKLILGPPLI